MNTRRGGQRGTEYHNKTPRRRQDSSTSWPLEHWFRFSLAWSKDFLPFPSGNSNPERDPRKHRERWQRNAKGARADQLCKSNRKAINISSHSGQSFQVSLTVNTVNIGGLLSYLLQEIRGSCQKPPQNATGEVSPQLCPVGRGWLEASAQMYQQKAATCPPWLDVTMAMTMAVTVTMATAPPGHRGGTGAPRGRTGLEKGKALKIKIFPRSTVNGI